MKLDGKELVQVYCREVCRPANARQCEHCNIESLNRFILRILAGKSIEDAARVEREHQLNAIHTQGDSEYRYERPVMTEMTSEETAITIQ